MRNNKSNNKGPQRTELRVKTDNATLLDFLQQSMAGISRTKAKAILSGGGVKIGKHTVTQFDHPLHAGDIVSISKHKRSQDLKSRFVRIVFEDRWIVVIEKAVGILSMGSQHNSFCVKTLLDEYMKKRHLKCTSHVVHRLDRDTSGLMIYAKTLEAQEILENNWHDIVTDRRYISVVSGRMEEKEGTITSYLKDNKQFFTYSSQEDNGGKFAITHFQTITANDEFSLVELKLETGRKNQIRVHMQDLNHPVVGDVKYGDGSNPIGRLGLHAFRLNFYHPITNEPMKFETPYPKNFTSLFE